MSSGFQRSGSKYEDKSDPTQDATEPMYPSSPWTGGYVHRLSSQPASYTCRPHVSQKEKGKKKYARKQQKGRISVILSYVPTNLSTTPYRLDINLGEILFLSTEIKGITAPKFVRIMGFDVYIVQGQVLDDKSSLRFFANSDGGDA